MSDDTQGYDAYFSHPDFGTGMVHGQIFLTTRELRFESPSENYILPLGATRVSINPKDDDWITLSDERKLDIQFQIESRVLEDSRFTNSKTIQLQLQKQLGKNDQRRRVTATVWFLAGFLVIAWLFAHAASWTVPFVAHHISVEKEIAFGDKAYAKVKPQLQFVDDSNLVDQINAMAQPLVQHLPTNGIPFRFYIVEGRPNAFALPGGRIMINRGLLNILDNQDQLLGVIAHESAHVLQRHADQQILSDRGPLFVLEILASGNNSVLGGMAFPSALLIHDSFSQRYEREADACGWDYLVAAGINPHGEIEALQKLRDANHGGGDDSLRGLESHPDIDQRIAWLNEKWNKLPDRDHFEMFTNPVPTSGQ